MAAGPVRALAVLFVVALTACYSTLASPPGRADGGPADAGDVFGGGGMSPDPRPYVGTLANDESSVLATQVSASMLVTCKACLALDGGPFRYTSSAGSRKAIAIAPHPSLDLALVTLAAPLADPPVAIASAPPAAEGDYALIAPAASPRTDRDQYHVARGLLEADEVSWIGVQMTGELLCAMAGGPTFATGEILVGLHGDRACTDGRLSDLRIDQVGAWIATELATCPASGSCGGCGSWSCGTTAGRAVVTCAPDNTACGADMHCDADELECAAGACAVGLARCGDRCVDVAHDAANCGGCGHMCPTGKTCNQGACQ